MAELHSLPERYKNMSLGELHEEIRRMEQLLRLLKEKVEVSESRTSFSDTIENSVCKTQETETQTLPCRTKARDRKEPGCTRTLKAQEYRRYGRQMIMPEVGLSGMLKSPWDLTMTCLTVFVNRSISPQESKSSDRWGGRLGFPSCGIPGSCWRWHDWSRGWG